MNLSFENSQLKNILIETSNVNTLPNRLKEIFPNLSNADLRNADLRNANLSWLKPTDKNLTQARCLCYG